MALSQEQRDRALRILHERMPNPMCPLCQHKEWTLDSEAFAFIVSQDDLKNIKLAGRGWPSLVMVCRHCGNTHLLNLAVLGLTDLFQSHEATRKEQEVKSG